MAIREEVVERQPLIPERVKDVRVGKKAHPNGWMVFSVYSEGQGVWEWARVRAAEGMPGNMIFDSKPDAVEYWREIAPPGARDLQQRLDGVWVWLVEEETEQPEPAADRVDTIMELRQHIYDLLGDVAADEQEGFAHGGAAARKYSGWLQALERLVATADVDALAIVYARGHLDGRAELEETQAPPPKRILLALNFALRMHLVELRTKRYLGGDQHDEWLQDAKDGQAWVAEQLLRHKQAPPGANQANPDNRRY